MTLRTLTMLAATLALAACHSNDSATALANDQAALNTELPADATDAQICASIDRESNAGKEAMELAITDKYSSQLTPERIQVLNKSGDYNHITAEMVNGHCWSYGELTNDPNDSNSFHATLRCPVKLVSDDQAQPGKTVVEDVEEKSCEFDTPQGMPSTTPVSGRITRLPSS